MAGLADVNPIPLIPVAADEHVTPVPRVIWENDNPDTAGAIVALGDAGQVTVPIPV
jgi:hypothetical protein